MTLKNKLIGTIAALGFAAGLYACEPKPEQPIKEEPVTESPVDYNRSVRIFNSQSKRCVVESESDDTLWYCHSSEHDYVLKESKKSKEYYHDKTLNGVIDQIDVKEKGKPVLTLTRSDDYETHKAEFLFADALFIDSKEKYTPYIKVHGLRDLGDVKYSNSLGEVKCLHGDPIMYCKEKEGFELVFNFDEKVTITRMGFIDDEKQVDSITIDGTSLYRDFDYERNPDLFRIADETLESIRKKWGDKFE